MYKTNSGREITFIGAGNQNIKADPNGIKFGNIETLDQLFSYLLASGWDRELVGESWRDIYDHDQNPTKGQCSITSALVQDIFGGELACVHPTPETTHSVNIINGQLIDLTSDQFTIDNIAIPEEYEIVQREDVLSDMSKVARYNKLCIRLCQAIASELANANESTLKRSDLPVYESQDVASYLEQLRSELLAKNCFSKSDFFSTYGDRDNIANEIHKLPQADVAAMELNKYATANTVIRSAAVALLENSRQYLINDSIYKKSDLICEAERDILLDLIVDIKSLL